MTYYQRDPAHGPGPNNMGWSPVPGPIDTNAWADNASRTVPSTPGAWPQSVWSCEPFPLSFDASVAVTPLVQAQDVVVLPVGATPSARAVWATPIFDLAPTLQGATSHEAVGFSMTKGAGSRLYLDFTFFDLSGASTLFNVYICERSHPQNPALVRAVGPAQAMTQIMGECTTIVGQQTPRLLLEPPGGSRYWQTVVIIDRIGAQPATPRVNISAVCY